jgi:thiol-disulfide isomerase/thioredoxin
MDFFYRFILVAALGAAAGGGGVLLRRWVRGAAMPSSFDAADVGAQGPFMVEFTTPYCYECKEALPLLKAASIVHSTPLFVVDAKDRPELASKYEIRTTPTILVVDGAGKVLNGWHHVPPEHDLENALIRAGAN